MIKRIRFTAIAALIVLLGMGTFMAVAQERGGERGADRGPGGRFDPEQMREMMMSRLQESLQFNDDEWTVVEPMVSNIMELQRETRGGFGGPMMFGMMGGPGGPGGERRGGADANNERRRGMGRGFGADNPELTALSEILQSEGSAADIQEKLKAYRDAKAKKELALKNAQSELKKVLTVRQEAMLVLMGYLE